MIQPSRLLIPKKGIKSNEDEEEEALKEPELREWKIEHLPILLNPSW